ncbi:DUF2232 domain-containing protein [Marinivivus vitaminiproducens]|uniref:DUF2232 domain-containing protein n=1 Tax=Marinivivus vitaminiproducens TaxID=3035935 RepID=UPI002798075A|nr:DUF2232 domain-containing protein [Geminicoccaceae bacterium SCSIO 64248]
MVQPLPLSILAGIVGSGLFLAMIFGVPGAALLAYLTPLPLFLAGLAFGTGAATMASATAMVVIGLIGGGLAVVIYLLSFGLPIVVTVRQALLWRDGPDGVEWYPAGQVVGLLAAYGAGAIVLAGLLFANEPSGLFGALDAAMASLIATLASQGGSEAADLLRSAQDMFWLLPALLAVSWLLMILLNAVLAQALVARWGLARRPSPSIAAFTAPRWCLGVLLAGAVLSLVSNESAAVIGAGVLVVFLVPYLFVGLGVVHVWLRRWPGQGITLGLFYVSLVIFLYPLAFIVAALGLIEEWAHLRRRMT